MKVARYQKLIAILNAIFILHTYNTFYLYYMNYFLISNVKTLLFLYYISNNMETNQIFIRAIKIHISFYLIYLLFFILENNILLLTYNISFIMFIQIHLSK